MSLKNLKNSGKSFLKDISETVKNSDIFNKVSAVLETTLEDVQDYFEKDSKSKYENITFVSYGEIELTNEEIDSLRKQTKCTTDFIESLHDFRNLKFIDSIKVFYSNGEEVKVGDIVYSFKYKKLFKFEKPSEDNIDIIFDYLGVGRIEKSEKSIKEIETFIISK